MDKEILLETDISKSGTINSKLDDVKVIEHQKEIIPNDDSSMQIVIQKDQKENDPGSSLLSINDLHNNDNKILLLLNQETGANYSFKGLMRKLKLHQQSLTRALHRLEYLELVEKSFSGYKLTKNGESLLFKNGLEHLPKIRKRKDYIQLLQTYIPIHVKSNEIVTSLIGKWFNNLRWSGLIEGETDYILKWVGGEDSDVPANGNSNDVAFQVNLRIISDFIMIETNAISDKEKVEAMAGSYKILQQITKLFQNKLEATGAYMLNVDSLRFNRNRAHN